ncbi:hypothetical protein MtrunA17_Chr4g0068931 [Medicago truncatula]|uniref:Uncharacterized protein n=1 Tax=Medicago truncatula TaxID=3880 RepID=A0A072USS3_MEDTR|nr:hypothetical protein MTR_4g123050 [Medicago truncatula]RHN64420.1 hypothetical protein MtrunA17_Chr4g0068931 [Medicago truncatula]
MKICIYIKIYLFKKIKITYRDLVNEITQESDRIKVRSRNIRVIYGDVDYNAQGLKCLTCDNLKMDQQCHCRSRKRMHRMQAFQCRQMQIQGSWKLHHIRDSPNGKLKTCQRLTRKDARVQCVTALKIRINFKS